MVSLRIIFEWSGIIICTFLSLPFFLSSIDCNLLKRNNSLHEGKLFFSRKYFLCPFKQDTCMIYYAAVNNALLDT